MDARKTKGQQEEEDLSAEPYPSPRFFLRQGEQVYLEALNVAVKKFRFHAYLTDQRIFLIDVVEKKVKATAKDIPLDTIAGCIVEVSPSQDPVLVLSLRQEDNEIKAMKITFVQDGTDRSAEIDAWADAVGEEGHPAPAVQPEAAQPAYVPEPEPEPVYEPEPEPLPQPVAPRTRPVVIPQPREARKTAPAPESRTSRERQPEPFAPRTQPAPVQRETPPASTVSRPDGQPKPGYPSRAVQRPAAGTQPSKPIATQQPQPVQRKAVVPSTTTRVPQQAPPSRQPAEPAAGQGRKPGIETTMKTAMKTAMQPLRQPSMPPIKHPAVKPVREVPPPPPPPDHAEYYAEEHEEEAEEEPRQDTIFCYNCGRKVLRIANFCPECGTRQTHPKSPARKEPLHPAHPSASSHKTRPAQRRPPAARNEEPQNEDEYPGGQPPHRDQAPHKKAHKKTPDSTILHKFLRR
jgi:hypothetical protein